MKQRSIQNERAAFDQIFKAVGDPHRLKIIQLLAEQELNAGELLQSIDIVQSTLSHHMKCLVESGIVNARRNGKWTCYTLNPEVIHDAYDFLGQYLGGTKKTGTGGTAAEDTADSPVSSANSGQPSAPQDGEGPAKMKKKGSGPAEDEKKKTGVPDKKRSGRSDQVQPKDRYTFADEQEELPGWRTSDDDDDDEAEETSGGWWNPELRSERMDGKKAGKKHSGDLNAGPEFSKKGPEEEKKKKGKKSKKGKKNGKK